MRSKNEPLMTEVKDVGAVFAGSYAAGHDPRLNAEAQRKHVLPQAVSLANGGAAANVFEHNIAFNTAIQHMFELAGDKKYTTLACAAAGQGSARVGGLATTRPRRHEASAVCGHHERGRRRLHSDGTRGRLRRLPAQASECTFVAQVSP